MKQPSWEPSPGSLVAWLLKQMQARPLDLWTVTLATGQMLRWTTGDWPVQLQGNTWALGPGLSRSRVSQSIGVSVDSMQMSIHADTSVLLNGEPLLQAIARGVFDGAEVLLERAFFSDPGGVIWVNSIGQVIDWLNSSGQTVSWGDPTPVCQGIVPVFAGRWGACKSTRIGADVEVRSAAELLDVMVPGDIYQAGCRNTVFDRQCALSAASYTVTGSTSAAGDNARRTITSTTAAVIAKPAGWGDLGVLTFTSGANAGHSRTVRTHTLGGGVATVQAISPFPFPIAAGVGFTLRAGCDKLRATCSGKFANLARYRGEPYIPAPETIA